ncbi:MAG: TAXI family TRAP transporter solute-binding subunit [Rhizobiaceae bacterium]
MFSRSSFRQSLLCVATGLLLLPCAALAQEEVIMATGPSGSTVYIHGGIISEAVNDFQSQYRLTGQTTGGFKDSLALLLNGNAEIAMNSLVQAANAYDALGEYESVPNKGEYKKLRMVFTFGVVPHNFFVRADSGIRSLEDIRGKSININTPAGFTYELNHDLLELAGIPMDSFKPGTVSTGDVFEQVQNRVFDGALHVFDVGYAPAMNLALSTDLRWIGFDADVVAKLNERYQGLLPEYTIPAGVYRGQEESVATFGVAQIIIAREDTDEELVYLLTKAFWENLEAITEQNVAFKGMTLEIGAKKTPIPFHPGAIRYFKERGLL